MTDNEQARMLALAQAQTAPYADTVMRHAAAWAALGDATPLEPLVREALVAAWATGRQSGIQESLVAIRA